MQITRSRRLTIQPVQYESIEVGASITVDTTDLDPSWGSAEVSSYIDGYLTELLAEEVEQASIVTKNPQSFIPDYRYTGDK